MATLKEEIEKHIKKLVNPLKEEAELLAELKVKLTKKELKMLKHWAEDLEPVESQIRLNLNATEYGELSTKLIKKLNQEKTKQSICV